jgi:hypothetical protein
MTANHSIKNTGEKVKVFVGTEPKTEIARKVLECSIIRHTDMKVDFVPMIGREWEYSTRDIKVGTGFSLRRWMIPAYCGWQGRAIYMDADQLVFGDVWDLWTKPEQLGDAYKHTAWCTYQVDKHSPKIPVPQTSVMVLNCEQAKGQWCFDINEILEYLRHDPNGYGKLMHGHWLKSPAVKIATEWNHLNTFVRGKTKLLHYTKEPEQPWYKPNHPLADLWKLELSIAISMSMVTERMMREALAQWGKKEDWRNTNGLHPEYAKYIPKSDAKSKDKKTPPPAEEEEDSDD